jgi:fructokinase
MSETTYEMIGLGEILWDSLPNGHRRLGGAPANVAYHAAQLGNKAWIVSRIGADEDGKEILQSLKDKNMSTEFIQTDPIHPTGVVDIKFSPDLPIEYIIHENVAWDYIDCRPSLLEKAQQIDAVCFGSLAQRNSVSRQAIQTILRNLSQNTVRVFDINIRQKYYSKEVIQNSLFLCDILKINTDELKFVASLLAIPNSDDESSIIKILCRQFNLRLVALTRGENGSLLVNSDSEFAHPGFNVSVADTVGSGDAFTAAMVHHFLKGSDLAKMSDAANRLGAYVATQPGATPKINKKILNQIR